MQLLSQRLEPVLLLVLSLATATLIAGETSGVFTLGLDGLTFMVYTTLVFGVVALVCSQSRLTLAAFTLCAVASLSAKFNFAPAPLGSEIMLSSRVVPAHKAHTIDQTDQQELRSLAIAPLGSPARGFGSLDRGSSSAYTRTTSSSDLASSTGLLYYLFGSGKQDSLSLRPSMPTEG